jgi:hypothetical protein
MVTVLERAVDAFVAIVAFPEEIRTRAHVALLPERRQNEI